jgi:hypothetical protein
MNCVVSTAGDERFARAVDNLIILIWLKFNVFFGVTNRFSITRSEYNDEVA